MSKYYTPTIDEFHEGFECQYTAGKKYGYIDCIIDWQNMNYISLARNVEKKYRVKYLDKEDIESLGWKAIEDFQALQLGIPQIFYVYNSENKIYKLRHSQPDHLVITATQFNIFEGRIKNKNELKKLMKQLGIYE